MVAANQLIAPRAPDQPQSVAGFAVLDAAQIDAIAIMTRLMRECFPVASLKTEIA
jgi:hypothetical protein